MAKTPVKRNKSTLIKGYEELLKEVKAKVRSSQLKAAISVNKELIQLYWEIGRAIHVKQEKEGWGANVIEKLAKDLQNAFPGIEGFSRSNIFYMRSFFMVYEKVQQAVGQFENLPIFRIPWGHNVILIQKLKQNEERLWYAEKAIEHGWSRSMLETWIKANLYKREGKALTNFQKTLPAPQSDLAQQTIKDPYLFDFLTLHKDYEEKDLEEGLVAHIQRFLLELGQGFAFMGHQYPIEVGGDTSYIDLLFYHVKLKCYIVIELKARPFKPEDTGQLNYYLSAVDDLLRVKGDNPSIGILLCKSRNKIKAEYAFRDIKKPMGVVEYETMLTKALPKELKSTLPTVKEIEKELGKNVTA
jgi:predicted nuclease of restriction endonuclease-like (RecB) superfamily